MAQMKRHAAVQRVAMLSLHTSPMDQPGTGDAGGMNVYIVETATRMAKRGVGVEIFTRATSSSTPTVAELAPGVTVRSLTAGPFEGLRKEDLPAQLCALSAGFLREEARHPEGWYDVIHSHYWLSGQVGWLAKERWNIPLVHTMHTMAKVKNLSLAEGDRAEPLLREIGEEQVVEAADRLVANTDLEARQLVEFYGARAEQTAVVHPGVDLATFSPSDKASARRAAGLPADKTILLFVGRLQPLKAPDIAIRAIAELVGQDPRLRDRLHLVVCGGPSGSGLEHPTAMVDLAEELGVADLVEFRTPAPKRDLADLYRAADITLVPSYSESFGLVAVESQACGTPVLAAAVGGLNIAVAHGTSGMLLQNHDPRAWAFEIKALLTDPDSLSRLSRGAVAHAAEFSWEATTDSLLDVYMEAATAAKSRPSRVG
jgi:D-inositol-3-phosphate glycosyltransferase